MPNNIYKGVIKMKNKKTLVIVAAVVVVLAVVLGVVFLGGNKTPTPTPTPTPATEKEYKLGMGAEAGTHSNSQANLTIATVVLDDAGKIVACRIDVAQNKYKVADEEVTFSVLESKKELKERYNMKGSSGISKEWYEQAEAFEAFVVGKTAAEVAALTVVQNGTHWVSNDPVLSAGCTMDIVDFKAAVVKACNDEQGMKFTTDKSFKLGLGVNSANDKSAVTDDENYTIKLNVEFAASVVIDGKVAASLNDAYQPNIVVAGDVVKATVGTFNKGDFENNKFMTKRELKEQYAMIPASPIQTEWYEQSKNYSEFVVGKTGTEIAGLTLDSGLSAAGCTIYIGGINAVVAESVNNAR